LTKYNLDRKRFHGKIKITILERFQKRRVVFVDLKKENVSNYVIFLGYLIVNALLLVSLI